MLNDWVSAIVAERCVRTVFGSVPARAERARRFCWGLVYSTGVTERSEGDRKPACRSDLWILQQFFLPFLCCTDRDRCLVWSVAGRTVGRMRRSMHIVVYVDV